jgi:hypothetical protein
MPTGAGEPPAAPTGQPAPHHPDHPGGYAPPPAYQQYGPPPRRTNSLAIVALVCSLAGLITLISAPIGAVLGHMASREIARTGEEGAGLAKAAIWVGWIITGLIVVSCCAVGGILLIAGREVSWN